MPSHEFLLVLVVRLLIQYFSNVSAFNGRCPAGWTFFEHSCYKMYTAKRPFPAAQSSCESAGASLTSISSYEENQFVHGKQGKDLFWIGLNDIQQEGIFQWMDGTQFRYSWDNATKQVGRGYSQCIPPENTSSTYQYCNDAELDYFRWPSCGEPSHASTNEDCVYFTSHGYWNDYKCGMKLKYMCEKEANEEGMLAETTIICPHSFETFVEPGRPRKTVNWSEPAYLSDSLASHINRSHSPGAEFRVGVTWVNYTFEDAHNNIATCNFSITVLEVDTTPPTIVLCPSDITVTKVANVPLTISWEPPLATDFSGSVTLESQSHFSGDEFAFGVNNVTFKFTDESGNEAICFFRIYVIEVNNPMESLLDIEMYESEKVPGLIIGLYIFLGLIGLALILLFLVKFLRRRSGSGAGKQSYVTMNDGAAEICIAT